MAQMSEFATQLWDSVADRNTQTKWQTICLLNVECKRGKERAESEFKRLLSIQ